MTATSWALLLAVLGSVVVLVSRQGTTTGALAGLVVAVLAILGLGPGTLLPLAVFVLGAGALTRLGRGVKERAGAAEADRGRRSAVHVAAKLGVPMLLSVAGLVADSGTGTLLRIGFAGALCAAFADTAATEVGPLARGGALTLPGLRRVPHGTPGAVSLAGLAAAGAAAAACAAAGVASGLVPAPSWIHVAGSGFVATMVESVLTRTPAGRVMGHHGRNAVLSLLSATLASWAWAATVGGS